jgi:hypothetical protein
MIEPRRLEDISPIKGASPAIFKPKKGKKKGLDNLTGLLKDYRERYSSVQLQKEGIKWWTDVSD